jgi:predicted AlkP superfamily pyrophosphatase or phosphodiesterase
MKNKITLTALLLVLFASVFAGAGGHKRKVLIIGIDGCRADALKLEMDSGHAPHLDSLAKNGFYTMDSWHEDITWSGPSWSSIMTGVYHLKHGVTNNSYSGSNYNQYPYFPTHAKEIDSTFKCVQYTEWAPMSNNVYNDGWDQKNHRHRWLLAGYRSGGFYARAGPEN